MDLKPGSGISVQGTEPLTKWLWLIPTAVVLLAVLVVGAFMETISRSEQDAMVRALVKERLDAVRSRMERLLNKTLLVARGLETAIILNPGLSQEKFEVVAKRLIDQDKSLRHVALAPDLVITQVYPLDGNRKALGLDYRANEAQKRVALFARDTGRFVVTTPVKLMQGGEGFIGRLPVYLNPEDREHSFWGLVNAVVDAETLYRDSGLLDPELELEVAIRETGLDGIPLATFFGSDRLFSNSGAQVIPINLPSGYWEMAALPGPGLGDDISGQNTRRFVMIVLGFLVVGTAFLASQWIRLRGESASHISRLQAILDAAINQTSTGVVIIDHPGEKIQMINAVARDFFATGSVPINVGDSLGNLESLVRYDAQNLVPQQPALRIALETDAPVVNLETTIRLGDGSTRSALVNASPLHDQNGRQIGAISVFSDITELKREQEARVELESRLHTAIQSIESGFALWDQNDQLQMINDGFVEIHKELRSRIHLGMTFEDFLHAALAQYRLESPPEEIAVYIKKRLTDRSRLKDGDSHKFDWRTGNRWLSISERRSSDGWISALYVDLTERIENEERLRLAQEAAEKANHAKTVFLANMTHELRTPLNSIILTSEMMANQLFGELNDRYQEYSQIIHGSGRHLLALISDILDMAKIEAGEMKLDITLFSVDELVHECATMMNLKATENNLTLVTEMDRDYFIEADRLRIKQSFLNLLSNGVKFSRDGSIRIRCHLLADGFLALDVVDCGIGMDKQQIEIALQMFGQVEGSYKQRQFEGTGLGLPIASQLLELHGGSLELISQSGQGTTARMVLPPHLMANATDQITASSQ